MRRDKTDSPLKAPARSRVLRPGVGPAAPPRPDGGGQLCPAARRSAGCTAVGPLLLIALAHWLNAKVQDFVFFIVIKVGHAHFKSWKIIKEKGNQPTAHPLGSISVHFDALLSSLFSLSLQ